MAKVSKKKSRAAVMREYIQGFHESAGGLPTAKQVMLFMQKRRMPVKSSQAYHELGKFRMTLREERKRQPRAKRVVTRPYDELRAVKELADSLGGLDRLEELLRVLKELV